MFVYHKGDNGAVPPWEYSEAVGGHYQVGQLLTVNTDGKVAKLAAASVKTPPYLCMADATVSVAGGTLPCTRVSDDYIYETTLAAAMDTLKVGAKLSVAATGLNSAAAAGTFEVVSLDGTAEGDIVRGRWVAADAVTG